MKIKKKFNLNKKTKNLEFFITKNNNDSTNSVIYSLKKALSIIHQFHIRKKQILFVGIPFSLLKVYKRAAAHANHLFMPENCWVNGILTNPSTCFYSLLVKKKTDKKLKFLMRLSKKNSLVVLFNELESTQALKESLIKHTPIVSFDSTSNALSNNIYYPVKESNLNSHTKNSCIHTILLTILQKIPTESLNIYAQDTLLYKNKSNIYQKLPRKKNFNNKKFFTKQKNV
jgi:ribosomal protein S2